MKNKIFKRIAISIFCLSVTISVFGQSTKTCTEVCGKKPAKIEKAKVPTVVTETFLEEYPAGAYENWYGYPTFIDQSDWYGYNPYLYSNENPEYYIVEFSADKTPTKVIYNKTGKKIVTHKKLNSELPKAISAAISKGEYKTWKLDSEKEEIFRDTDADNMKVYKVNVENGQQKHILFYLADGELIKNKTIKP